MQKFRQLRHAALIAPRAETYQAKSTGKTNQAKKHRLLGPRGVGKRAHLLKLQENSTWATVMTCLASSLLSLRGREKNIHVDIETEIGAAE